MRSLNRLALTATTHCLTGCAIGEVLSTAFHWSNSATVLKLAFASDTASITIMEIVDNALMLLIPGAMNAPLDSVRFWGSLAFSLLLAGIAAFPVNRWLIARGRGTPWCMRTTAPAPPVGKRNTSAGEPYGAGTAST